VAHLVFLIFLVRSLAGTRFCFIFWVLCYLSTVVSSNQSKIKSNEVSRPKPNTPSLIPSLSWTDVSNCRYQCCCRGLKDMPTLSWCCERVV